MVPHSGRPLSRRRWGSCDAGTDSTAHSATSSGCNIPNTNTAAARWGSAVRPRNFHRCGVTKKTDPPDPGRTHHSADAGSWQRDTLRVPILACCSRPRLLQSACSPQSLLTSRVAPSSVSEARRLRASTCHPPLLRSTSLSSPSPVTTAALSGLTDRRVTFELGPGIF